MKRYLVILLIVAALLLVPFLVMQFTREVNWRFSDFLVAGILLYAAGFFCDLTLRKIKKPGTRIAICLLILLIVFLIWAELAVGIF